MVAPLLVVWATLWAGAAAAEGGAQPAPSLTDLLPPALGANLEELVKVAADTCEALPLQVLFSRYYTVELPMLQVVEAKRGGRRRRMRVSAAPAALAPGPSALPLYVPGWWNTPYDDSTTAIVDALLLKYERVLVLDTQLSFSRGYVGAASRVRPVAHLLYSFIKKLTQRGVPLESIHIIGFSLGAHVAGVTGKLIQKGMKKKLEQITALDPARPCFARSSPYRLDKSDAKFVQVIHSSSGRLGIEEPLGDVDVYINGVRQRQPECGARGFRLQCEHSAAWRVWAAAAAGGPSRAARCASWRDLERDTCTGDSLQLGLDCPSNANGIYLYKTDAETRSDLQEPPPTLLTMLSSLFAR